LFLRLSLVSLLDHHRHQHAHKHTARPLLLWAALTSSARSGFALFPFQKIKNNRPFYRFFFQDSCQQGLHLKVSFWFILLTAPFRDQFDQAHDKATELAWVSSRFGFIFKLAYIYSARAWLLAFVMLPFVSRVGVASAAGVSADVAAVRTTWQLVIEMLVANGRLLTLHAMSQHMVGLCKRVCDLMDGIAILDKVFCSFF
jgi:hypothetical protein